ncbi:uncharacterized protein LOC134769765 [Penaeus indicus]|uniref:uncharacterized protein LOC134769765 n=1 Tax=Penaeus indicus TaxID=29960 RepID=UPI00300C8864
MGTAGTPEASAPELLEGLNQDMFAEDLREPHTDTQEKNVRQIGTQKKTNVRGSLQDGMKLHGAEGRETLTFYEYCECIYGGSSRVTEGIRITPPEQRLITRCVDVASVDVWYPLHVLYNVYTCIILRVCVLIYKQQSASLQLHTRPFLLAAVLILTSIRSELLALPRLLYRRVATSCDSRFIFLPAGRVRNSFECLRHTVGFEMDHDGISALASVHAASTTLEELEAEKARLKTRLEETREALVCRVCLDRPVAAVFMPCAHLNTCHSCSASLTMCPLCRTPIHYAAAVIID